MSESRYRLAEKAAKAEAARPQRGPAGPAPAESKRNTFQFEGDQRTITGRPAAKPDPKAAIHAKMAPELHGLAEKLVKEGKDGNLTVGKIEIKNGRIEVRVQLTTLGDEVLAKLKKLGFKVLAQAKSVKLVIGTIDVKQLEKLAELPEVRRIDPS